MRYFPYSQYLKEAYGEKVYKIPVNIDATCPNRDGRVGIGGCIFCGEKGAGFENLSNEFSVTRQLKENMEYIGKKYGAKKFIAYFQNFTNTYIPLDDLYRFSNEAASIPGIVELCFSTRPDCIPDTYLMKLKEISEEKQMAITIELGLQTANYHTLVTINRGHGLGEFIDSVLRIKKFGFKTCAHVILNLPWDDDLDSMETAKIISALHVDFVKLHSLYIEKGTELCRMYEKGDLKLITLEEYVDRTVVFLEHLSEDIAIQRLAARAPQEVTVFCNWDTSWWKIKDRIEERLEEKDTRQGSKTDYLGGMEYGK